MSFSEVRPVSKLTACDVIVAQIQTPRHDEQICLSVKVHLEKSCEKNKMFKYENYDNVTQL